MATYSSILAGIMLWTEEQWWIQSMGLQKEVTHNLANSTENLHQNNLYQNSLNQKQQEQKNLDQSPLLPEPALGCRNTIPWVA